MKICIVYHDNCWDGIACLWMAVKAFPTDEKDFYPATYGKTEPPDLKEYDLLLCLDFSFKEFPEFHLDFKVITVDHHESSKDLKISNGIIEMGTAACLLTHRYLDLQFPIPDVIRYIADRDVWKWELPDSREINAYIQEQGKPALETLEYLMLRQVSDYVSTGRQFLVARERIVQRHAEKFKTVKLKDGTPCKMVNATHCVSEIGNAAESLACVFICSDDNVILSFRNEGAREAAEIYGGGGHARAAAAKISYEEFVSLWNPQRDSRQSGGTETNNTGDLKITEDRV